MNVGIVVPGFSADESDWCIPALRNLVQRLALTDDVRVLAMRYPAPARRYRVVGAEVAALGGGTAGRQRSAGLWARAIAQIAAAHRHRRFDVLHAFWANEAGAVTALAGRLLDIPTVVSLAGGELVAFRDIGYGGQLARTERAKVLVALRLASAVTAGSAAMLRLARPWIESRERSRVERVPLGVDVCAFQPPREHRSSGPAVLVHVASLVPVKDQRTLLSAMALLRRGGYPCTLEIAGNGSEELPLRRLATDLGLDGSVQFLGAVRHDALPSLYRRASVFVLSSRHEAQCMAALEAAACGIPVAGTAVGIVPELSPSGAVSAPLACARALADGIAGLLQDPRRRREMGLAAREYVEAEYSLARCVERFHACYAAISRT